MDLKKEFKKLSFWDFGMPQKYLAMLKFLQLQSLSLKEEFVEFVKAEIKASKGKKLLPVRIQNEPNWGSVGDPEPTIVISKGDDDWPAALENAKQGNYPTDSKEWKKGVYALYEYIKPEEYEGYVHVDLPHVEPDDPIRLEFEKQCEEEGWDDHETQIDILLRYAKRTNGWNHNFVHFLFEQKACTCLECSGES